MKTGFDKIMIFSSFTCNCENVTLNRTNRRKIEVVEKTFLIGLAGYKLNEN